jgi:hypothetical protein
LLRVIIIRRKVATRQRNLMPPRIPRTLIRSGGRTRSAMCGKKGHPASACSVKPLSDNDDKSIRSSKSARNAMAAIQKSMKTMDKAMTKSSHMHNLV